jgi:hypothetical protein
VRAARPAEVIAADMLRFRDEQPPGFGDGFIDGYQAGDR